jgi:putative transposase
VTDKEWAWLEPLMPAKTRGRHRQRELFNAVLYVARSGCAWRMLPHDFPPWTTVYTYFRRLQRRGRWQLLNDVLREEVREQAGKKRQPSGAIIDSQTAKTTEKGGPGA